MAARLDLLNAVHTKATALFRGDRVSIMQMTSGGQMQRARYITGFIILVQAQASLSNFI